MKILDGVLYEFQSAVLHDGQIFSMFGKASSRFKLLKAFLASICRIA